MSMEVSQTAEVDSMKSMPAVFREAMHIGFMYSKISLSTVISTSSYNPPFSHGKRTVIGYNTLYYCSAVLNTGIQNQYTRT